MYKLVVIGTIIALTQAQVHPVNQQTIDEIKEKATTWEPMELDENPLHDLTVQEARSLCGTIVDDWSSPFPEPEIPEHFEAATSFDARTQWPKYIHPIRNQAQCGSCWAFGSTEALSDRFAIKTNGSTNVILSPQDMLSCDKSDYGCSGGYLNNAWNYLKNTGVVTDTCVPYTSATGSMAACPSKCTATGQTWKKYKVGSVVTATNAATIQAEIQTNGPMETAFNVYSDFYNYKSGIYTYTSGYLVGGHAVKMLGWGVLNGVKYWICANSWGTTWGESGYFRIAYNQCGIDSGLYAGAPVLSSPSPFEEYMF